MHLFRSEYPIPNHVLVHVSDPHFVEEGLLYGGVDPQTGLVEVLDAVEASGLKTQDVTPQPVGISTNHARRLKVKALP